MKFCVNCRHYIDGLPSCAKAVWTSMVTGDEFMHSCHEARSNQTLCGKDASWFEAKDDAIPTART